MDTKSAIIALMSVWGVGTCTAMAQEPSSEPSANPLLNKVWTRAGDESLPGPMQIFLSDGTLVTDSCWETYRLSRWEQVSETSISWEEDGMTISADIAQLTETELVLNLHLGSEVQEQRFTVASVPYVCPDMIR
jgi:hypothetical protein